MKSEMKVYKVPFTCRTGDDGMNYSQATNKGYVMIEASNEAKAKEAAITKVYTKQRDASHVKPGTPNELTGKIGSRDFHIYKLTDVP